jgi:hypothetical protein
MHLTGIDFLFWAAGFVEHLVLLAVLLIRARAKTFPVFTALIATNVIRTIALYFVAQYGSKHAYANVYFSLAVCDLILQFALVYEVASDVFRPLGRWAPDVRNSLVWIVCLSIAMASGLTWLASRPPSSTWLRATLIRGNFFSATLLSELFVGMIVLSATVGLHWRTHVAKIAQGLGLYSLVCIAIEAGHTYLGMDRSVRISAGLSFFRMSVYLLCLLYWIVTLWLDAPAPKELSEDMRRQLFTLQGRVAYDLQKLRAWRRQ